MGVAGFVAVGGYSQGKREGCGFLDDGYSLPVCSQFDIMAVGAAVVGVSSHKFSGFDGGAIRTSDFYSGGEAVFQADVNSRYQASGLCRIGSGYGWGVAIGVYHDRYFAEFGGIFERACVGERAVGRKADSRTGTLAWACGADHYMGILRERSAVPGGDIADKENFVLFAVFAVFGTVIFCDLGDFCDSLLRSQQLAGESHGEVCALPESGEGGGGEDEHHHGHVP